MCPWATIRAVMFDLGGVLEQTPRTGWQRRWAGRLGLTEAQISDRLGPIWSKGSIGALTLAQVEASTAAALALDHADLRAMMDDAWAEYVGTLNVELTRYFSGLRPRYRTGIVSNSFVGARERELALYGFEELCDTIVYSHEVGVMKPDPAIYLIACRRLDVTPGEVVFLDDVPANVQAAAELGMTAITFLSTDQAIAELQRLLRTTHSLPQR